jgi:hypothetical protein
MTVSPLRAPEGLSRSHYGEFVGELWLADVSFHPNVDFKWVIHLCDKQFLEL